VNLGRERIRALQCPPDESEIERGGFCYNWIQRIWLNSHEWLQSSTNTITFWDLLISHVHSREQPFCPLHKEAFNSLRPARWRLIFHSKVLNGGPDFWEPVYNIAKRPLNFAKRPFIPMAVSCQNPIKKASIVSQLLERQRLRNDRSSQSNGRLGSWPDN
jgi:hypothetical protein